MYKNQILPDVDQNSLAKFFEAFSLVPATEIVTLDYLNSNWYNFTGSTKKRHLKFYYNDFSGYRINFKTLHNNWLRKYEYLYNYLVSKLTLLDEIPDLEAKLTKPLTSYALKDKWGYEPEYSNSKAEAVRLSHRNLAHLNKKIKQTLATPDEPPVPSKELLKSWSNL